MFENEEDVKRKAQAAKEWLKSEEAQKVFEDAWKEIEAFHSLLAESRSIACKCNQPNRVCGLHRRVNL